MVKMLINPDPDEDEISWEPEDRKIFLRDGRFIYDDSNRWTIPTPTEVFHIDWTRLAIGEGPHLNSIKHWVAHNLRNKSVSVAAKGFWFACALFNAPAFIEAAKNLTEIPYLAFSQAMSSLDGKNRWQLHAARDYYTWCESQQFPYFSEEVVARLQEVVIGGNAKGEAVRSADPNEGPLTALEVAEVTAALRAAYLNKTMPIQEQAAVWLALAFGANSSQYAMMREEDIVPEYIDGHLATTLVSVPRHKKGHIHHRSEFKVRKANRFVGRVLRDLVEENEKSYSKGRSNEPRPLFRRKRVRGYEAGLEEWAWHLRAPEFTKLLQNALSYLEAYGRDGSLLKLNTRRLRYTFASRMVGSGASPYAVAAALDHSDLQNVGVYFDIKSDIVEHLDKAMAMVLAERAQRFAQIVESEADAINGDKVGSRRYYSNREKRQHYGIGTCGHTSFCNVVAPYACYLCPKFQAWMDGPHELVLDHLIESRNQREQMNLDPKIISIEDQLIVHVAEVISRIAEMKEKEGKADG
jgi:integrase